MTRHEFFASIVALFACGKMRKKKPTKADMIKAWDEILNWQRERFVLAGGEKRYVEHLKAHIEYVGEINYKEWIK